MGCFVAKDSTAGIADPYWYEWSVGLSYIIEMLSPDAGISSVTLQATGVKGLDDVVVAYKDGAYKLVQVKHTRVSDTLTFGDLVAADGGDAEGNDTKTEKEKKEKGSLLRTLASAWKHAKDKGQQCGAQLFTNRKGGTRVSTVKRGEEGQAYGRPAFAAFWSWLKGEVGRVQKLSDVAIGPEWGEAWAEWTAQLVDLSDDEKIQFMRSLDISFDQLDLEEFERDLIKKISAAFSINEQQAALILQSFNHALRKWTTTRRGQTEAVTAEEVYSELSLPSQQEFGDHKLPPPEPFFSSRMAFVDTLAADLLARKRPVIFLTGSPGAGKTSIVSLLTNRHEPVVDLRFFAYLPITPQSPFLPADAGRATTAQALWSDLLTQLRIIFSGRLAQFQVPIRNDHIELKELRAHVLRLADVLSRERGRVTVIAIDGIDHAARAGLGNRLNLLDTLVPPDAVPNTVCFLIAGQPRNDKYPLWLKASHEWVLTVETPPIALEDVSVLVTKVARSLPPDQLDTAARLIYSVSSGNTLSAVFAAHESADCATVAELGERLERRRLGDGIAAYYDAIWSHAVAPLEARRLDIPEYLAGAVALSRARLTGRRLADIYADIGVTESEWTSAMRRMRPLLVEESGSFRVFHNDVRVYLQQKMSAEPEAMSASAGRIADYYLRQPECVVDKHIDLFRLLKLAGRGAERSRHFTPDYVMEGWVYGRSMNELLEQSKDALSSAVEARDWDQLHQVTCAIATWNQLDKSLSWTGREPINERPIDNVPPVLLSEGSVLPLPQWTVQRIKSVIDDIGYLCRAGEIERARGIEKRWFGDMSPADLVSRLPEREVKSKLHDHMGRGPVLDEEVAKLLQSWGSLRVALNPLWIRKAATQSDDQLERVAYVNFVSGWVRAAAAEPRATAWARALSWATFYGVFWAVIEVAIEAFGTNRRWLELAFTLRQFRRRRRRMSAALRVRAAGGP